MRVMLISPFSVMPLNEHADLYPREPLGLEYLAAVARSHDVQILDCKGNFPGSFKILPNGMIHIGASLKQIKNKIRESKPDLVGVSALFDTQINSVYSIFDVVKNVDRDIITVIGGCAASCYPMETLNENKNIDIAVYGEGESTFLELLDKEGTNLKSIDGIVYRENGKITQNKTRDLIKNLDSLPFPRRDIVPFESYSKPLKTSSEAILYLKTKGLKFMLGRATKYLFRSAANKVFGREKSDEKVKSTYPIEAKILTSRGCPNNCYFCAIGNVWGGRTYRMRSAENVLTEMTMLYEKHNVRHFGIVDENFSVSKRRTIEICKGVVERGLDVSIKADSGLYIPSVDKEVIMWMKKAGFNEMVFAVESGNEAVLQNVIRKKVELRRVKELAKICKDLGVKTAAFFMVGVPGETKETMADTVKFATDSDFDEVRLFTCQPFRGSRLYEDAKKNGWLTEDFDPSQSLIFENDCYLRTPEFSPADVCHIAESAKEILRKQNRMGSEETCKVLRKPVKNSK